LALLLALCVLASALCFRFGIGPSAAYAAGLAVLLLALGWLAFNRGLWLELAPGLVGIAFSAGVTFAWRNLFEERERARLRQIFGRYVSHEMMEEMLADPGRLLDSLSQRRVITVLFSDINNFSTVSEKETPERVAWMLSQHYTEMSRVIFRNRGTIIRFVGDQFMVLFGAPRPHPEPERAAVRTALEMAERLRELEREDETGCRGFYQVKIGVHTGEMLLASIGDEEKSDYMAVGDNANLGARIQDLTKKVGASILISETTYQAALGMEGVGWVDRDVWEVKGREQPIRVYEPITGPSPPDPPPPSGPSSSAGAPAGPVPPAVRDEP
ncbi:MAG: adenylate/guanylate cyclase domain-containing protein, partial [Candidatus Eremiobacterota bacterium]